MERIHPFQRIIEAFQRSAVSEDARLNVFHAVGQGHFFEAYASPECAFFNLEQTALYINLLKPDAFTKGVAPNLSQRGGQLNAHDQIAAVERFRRNSRHALRHRNLGQFRAVFEDRPIDSANRLEAGGISEGFKIRAAGKRTAVFKRFHGFGQVHFLKRRAAHEGFSADGLHTPVEWDVRQRGTVPERLLFNLHQRGGQMNLFKVFAGCKRAMRNLRHAFGHRNLGNLRAAAQQIVAQISLSALPAARVAEVRQGCAVDKRLHTDVLHAVGQQGVLKADAVIESSHSDKLKGIRHRYLFKVLRTLENALRQIRNARRDIDLPEAGTVREDKAVRALEALGISEFRQSGAAAERKLTQICHAARNTDALKARTAFECSIPDFRQAPFEVCAAQIAAAFKSAVLNDCYRIRNHKRIDAVVSAERLIANPADRKTADAFRNHKRIGTARIAGNSHRLLIGHLADKIFLRADGKIRYRNRSAGQFSSVFLLGNRHGQGICTHLHGHIGEGGHAFLRRGSPAVHILAVF